MASGNIYFNKELKKNDSSVTKRLWNRVPTSKAYDMESAGFLMAAGVTNTPAFVVRGISDHGDGSGFTDSARYLASAMAGAVVKSAIQTLERVELQNELITLQNGNLRGLHHRYDGTWNGGFAYLDDDGELVVVADREVALFQNRDGRIAGVATSEAIVGNFPRAEAGYTVVLHMNSDGSASGRWLSIDEGDLHRGVMMGAIDPGNSVIRGRWVGSHKEGIRDGVFVWFNSNREGKSNPDYPAGFDDSALIKCLTEEIDTP